MLHSKYIPGISANTFNSCLLCKLVQPTGICTTVSNHNPLKTGSTSGLFVDYFMIVNLLTNHSVIIQSKWLFELYLQDNCFPLYFWNFMTQVFPKVTRRSFSDDNGNAYVRNICKQYKTMLFLKSGLTILFCVKLGYYGSL